jgi:hypothetical protein
MTKLPSSDEITQFDGSLFIPTDLSLYILQELVSCSGALLVAAYPRMGKEQISRSCPWQRLFAGMLHCTCIAAMAIAEDNPVKGMPCGKEYSDNLKRIMQHVRFIESVVNPDLAESENFFACLGP